MSTSAGNERAANARAVLFTDAVAGRVGLNPTDLLCLDLVAGDETVTPGRLAELSGLTTGAVTGVLDRLEAAGFVRRELDPSDRRRFVIRLLPERQAEVDALYAGLVDGLESSLRARSKPDRELIENFLAQRGELLTRELERLRGLSARASVDDEAAGVATAGTGELEAPLGSATRGTLIFESGAARLSIHATPVPGQSARIMAEAGYAGLVISAGPADLLYRATVTGPRPELNASGGTLSVRYRFRGFLQRRVATLSLNPTIPWTVLVRGGLSELRADLSGIQLQGFELKGGATQLRLDLPEPRGTVRLSLKGNSTAAEIAHAREVALSLDLNGGVERMRFQGKRLGTLHGKAHLENAAYRDALDRYQVVFKGNATELSIGG